MNIPDFHNSDCDGLRIGPNKLLQLFLRTQDGKSFVLTLQEVAAPAVSGSKQGQVILACFSAAPLIEPTQAWRNGTAWMSMLRGPQIP
jgi:hypothetical protein